jgi:gamma-tubulin complex component 2
VWSFIKANVPYFPEWVFKRNAFNKFSQPSRQETESMREKKLLKSFPPEVQEILLVEDILDIMMGFDGVYIKKHKTLHQFVIEPHLEQPSCNVANKQLAEKILNLPLMYYKVENYINVYSIQEGIMCQALCGGLRIMVKEYKTMVCQFDQEARNGLTLQKLWFLMQPSIKIMESFSKLVTEA